MAFAIVTTKNARKDIQDAIDWENSRSSGLGVRFFHQLQNKLTVIATTPLVGSIRYENVRCIRTDVFEYLIHYVVDEIAQKIIVIRVLHTRRMPVW
jgi:toxin ParE1/3/4